MNCHNLLASAGILHIKVCQWNITDNRSLIKFHIFYIVIINVLCHQPRIIIAVCNKAI